MFAALVERGHELDPLPGTYKQTTLAPNQTATVTAPPDDGVEAVVVVHYTGGPFRFLTDGGTPSATLGWPAEDGDVDVLSRYEARNFQAVLAQGAVTGIVRSGAARRRR